MKSIFLDCQHRLRFRRVLLGLFSVLVLMCAQGTHADTTYVYFNTGKVHVFPDSCVLSMTSGGGYFTVTALDGQVYTYVRRTIRYMGSSLDKRMPVFTGFMLDNKYNHQVITDAAGVITGNNVNVSVLGIGKWLTPTFTVSDSAALVHMGAEQQFSNVNRHSFATDRVYTVGYDGDLILSPLGDGRYGMLPFGREYKVHVNFLTDNNTAVPRIDINTVGGVSISSREYYVDAEIIIDGQGIFPSMTDSVQVKGRGHYSWTNDPNGKNPYRLKFKEKVKPLGLKKGKNWVLLANNMYGSLLTNAFGMKAASIIGNPAANHIIPVDLYVNGVYKGNYNFTEKIGFSNNSIDLDDETAATLLEIDVNYDCEPGQKFVAYPSGLLVNVHEPKFAETGSTVLRLSDVEHRFERFTTAVVNNNRITDHVDADYMARYIMLNEFIYNFEMFNPKSVWCYHENILDDSTKFIFGPVWDFDWAFGFDIDRNYYTCDPTIDYYTTNKEYWQRDFMTTIRYDREIVQQLYKHWDEFVNNKGIDELCDYCIEYFNYAHPSLLMNRWYIKDYTDYEAQAQTAAEWLRQRAIALYEGIKIEATVLPGDLNDNGKLDIEDVTILIDYLLSGGSDINPVVADVDQSGSVGIDDVTTLIDLLLRGEH